MSDEDLSPGLNAVAPPRSYEVIRATWLSRPPRKGSGYVAFLTTLVLILFCQVTWLDQFQTTEAFSASYASVFGAHKYWQAFTTLFAHADWEHLGSNSLMFFILGYFLYGYFGFLIFPIGAFVVGTLASFTVLPTYEADIKVIGASGVVYAMGGCWLVLYFFLHRSKKFWHRWLRTLGVAILLFMPSEAFKPDISHRTHFVGFVYGVILGFIYYLSHRQAFRAAEVRETIIEEADDSLGSSALE